MFPFPPKTRARDAKLTPTHSWDNPKKLLMFIGFLVPWTPRLERQSTGEEGPTYAKADHTELQVDVRPPDLFHDVQHLMQAQTAGWPRNGTRIGNINRRNQTQGRPSKPNQRKGQNEKFMNFALFREFLVFFLRKISTIHIELLFRNAPAKSSWTDLSLVAGATPDKLPNTEGRTGITGQFWGVPSMGPCCEMKWIETGAKRPGPPCEMGRNGSGLVQHWVKLSQMPLGTAKIAGHRGNLLTKCRLPGGTPKIFQVCHFFWRFCVAFLSVTFWSPFCTLCHFLVYFVSCLIRFLPDSCCRRELHPPVKSAQNCRERERPCEGLVSPENLLDSVSGISRFSRISESSSNEPFSK